MPRVKRIEHHCSHCNRTAKMEIVGEMEGVTDKSWFRCSKCRHSVLISLEEVMMENPSQEAKIEVKDCTPYSPDKTYDIGHPITADDGWFRPVDIKAGPDGALYIADFYEGKISHRAIVKELGG